MAPTEAVQGLLLGLWAVAGGMDSLGLLRHLGRWRHWYRRVRELPAEGHADLVPAAQAKGRNEAFRSELKFGLVLWAAATIIQRWQLGGDAPVSWESWAILLTHLYLLTVLTVWTQRERG